MDTKDVKRINVLIPETLHTQVKVQMALTGATLGEYISMAIKEKLERDAKRVN